MAGCDDRRGGHLASLHGGQICFGSLSGEGQLQFDVRGRGLHRDPDRLGVLLRPDLLPGRGIHKGFRKNTRLAPATMIPSQHRFSRGILHIGGVLLLFASFSFHASAEPIPVKEKQGTMHGFLVLKSTEGKVIAVGDQVSVVQGNQVRSRLIFHFCDGSIDDESTVFKQGAVFQLISDHHVQKGRSFPEPLDLALNAPAGKVTWHEKEGGKEEVKTEHMDLPPDLSNGMVSLIVENFPQKAAEMKVSYLAGSSKPRIVKLSVKPQGEDIFHLAGVSRRSNRFNIHIEIGGAAGIVAPILGKQPSDIKMWVTDGEIPTFLKMEGALYEKGPVWTMELICPVWSEPAK